MNRLLLLLAVLMVTTGCKTVDPKSKVVLTLDVWGAPWTPSFHVTINELGQVTEVSRNGDQKRLFWTRIPQPEFSELMNSAKAVITLPPPTEKVNDGTNLRLEIVNTAGSQVKTIRGIAPEYPEVKKLLSGVNQHLPKDRQVW